MCGTKKVQAPAPSAAPASAPTQTAGQTEVSTAISKRKSTGKSKLMINTAPNGVGLNMWGDVS